MPCTLSMEACRRPAAMKRESSLVGSVSHDGKWVDGVKKKKKKIRNEVVVRQFIPVAFLETKDAGTKIGEKRIDAMD